MKAFPKGDNHKDDMRIIAGKVKLLEEFIRDCAVNWDCDSDSHRYDLLCRKCEAKKIFVEAGNDIG